MRRGGKLLNQPQQMRLSDLLVAAHFQLDPSEAVHGAGQLIAVWEAADYFLVIRAGRIGLADVVAIELARAEQVVQHIQTPRHHHCVGRSLCCLPQQRPLHRTQRVGVERIGAVDLALNLLQPTHVSHHLLRQKHALRSRTLAATLLKVIAPQFSVPVFLQMQQTNAIQGHGRRGRLGKIVAHPLVLGQCLVEQAAALVPLAD